MAYPFGPVTCDPSSVEEYNPSSRLGRKRWGRRHTRVPTSLRRSSRERPVFETLEPRLLLSADLTYGAFNDLTLKFDAGLNQYQLVDDTDTVVSFDTADPTNTINITGTAGADSLGLDLGTLGSGKTINFLGTGDDTLKSTKNSNQTLTNTSLDAGGQTFTLSGFEKAELTGGAGENTLDASAFTGDVTLSGLGGADRLIGGTGNDTLIGGLGDDVYEFADNWGVDSLNEAAGEGTDRLDFTATTGTLQVNEALNKRISSGAHTLTNLDTAAEELDIAITSDIQDSLEIGINAAKDLVTRLTSSVSELSSALPMLNPDTGSFSALFGLADMFQELREQIDGLGAGVNLSDVTDAITNLPGVGSAVDLSPGYQGDASNNLEIVVDAGISKSILNQLIDIDLGTEGAFLNFNIDAQLSVDATFAGSVGIGVTTVGTPTAFLAGAELDFTVDVDGNLDSAALDLGFLDVTVDGGAGNEISYSGGLLVTVSDPVDNKIALSEVTDLGFDLASLVSVTPTGTGFTTGDLNVTVQSGINLPGDIPLTSGILNIVFPTFTDFYNGVLPSISLTSGSIDLFDFSNITPSDVAGMLSDLVDTLSALSNSDLLDITIPLTGVKVGDLLDFGEAFKQDILDPLFVSGDATIPDFDDDGIPDFDFDSIQDLVDQLAPVLGLPVGALLARFNPTSRELSFNLNFSSLLNIGTSPISFGASLGDLAGISTTSQFDLSTSFDFNLDFGIGLAPSEDIELLPSPFSPDNVAELSISPQDGASASDFSVQVVRVDNATLGSYKLADPTGAFETGTIQYNDSDTLVASALNSMAIANALDWRVEVTRTVEGNDSVYTVVFKDATNTDKSFNPSGLLLPPLDDGDNTLKGAADGVLSSTATFDITLFSKAVTLLAGTPSEFTVPETELGSITVTVNRDTANASIDDLKVDVQTEVNTQLVNQGLTLGFLSGGELSTGALGNGGMVTASGTPFQTLHEDVEFTVIINGTDEYSGSLRAVDVLDGLNGGANDDVLELDELNATLTNSHLDTPLEAAIFDVLDSAGLSGSYNVAVTTAPGNKLKVDVTAPGGDTVEVVFKSPITVDAGGGRIALSTLTGNLSAEVFNPSVGTTSRIEVNADYNDPAFQEMGLLSSPTPFDGVLDDDIEFSLDVDGTTVDVFLSAASTAGNTSIDDLLTQLNTAVDTGLTNAGLGTGLVDAFRVDPEGNRLGITGDHTNVDRLSIDVPDSLTTGPNAGNANGAITELGFESGEGDPFAGASAEFFIDNVSLDAMASIDATTLNLVANVGFLEVEADGSGSISANANLSVINPLDGGTRVNGETLIAAVSQGKFLYVDPPAFGGTLDNLNTGFLDVAIGGGLTFSLDIDPTAGLFDGANNPISNFDATLSIDGTSPNWLTSLPEVNLSFTGPDFDAIISEFKDLSFQDIIDGLSFFVEFLQGLDGTSPGGSAIADALDYDLPLVNRSVADLVQIADELADRLDALSADPSGSVQALNDLLVDIFDLPAAASNILSFNPTTSVLGINLGFDAAASLTRPFSLNLADVLASAGAPEFLTDLVSLEAGGNLGVSAGVDVELALGLDLTGADKGLFLFTGANGTRLAANASATGNNLSFRAGLGPFQVLVDGGSGSLGAGIDVTLNDDGDGRLDLITLGSGGGISLPSLGDLNIDITGTADATLPLFVGSVDNPIPIGTDNEIILSADLDDLIGGVPGAFNVTLPNLDLFSNPPGIFELLADPSVVVDGLDAVLLQIQEALEGQIFGFELPFVADALKDNPVSNFIEDFRDDFLNPLANTLRANNVNLDGLISLIQDSIFNTFNGLGILKDSDGVGGLSADDIVHSGASLSNLSEDFIQFDFKLGDSFTQALDIAFDFGIPGLGLEADFTPTITLDWNLDFGFGLDETKGFYFVSSDPDELTLSIDLDLGSTQGMPAFARGQLLFLALGITDGIDLDDDGDLEFSGLNLTGAINVADPNDDGRLTIGELISGSIGDIFQPSLTGSADILMQAEVDFTTLGSADLARVLPSISTGIIVHWGLSATPNTGLVVDDPSIVLADVSLDLGSFISDFAGPVLGNIADIIEPLDFLIGPDGFLNKRIPLLSDLAGKTITGRDLIETFDPTAKIGPFLDAIAELFFLVDLIGDAEAALATTGSLNFNFGDLVLTDPTSFFDVGAVSGYLTGDRIDLSLPNLNKNSFKNVNFKNMSLNSPSQEGSGGGQAVTRFQSGVTSGGSFQFNLFDPATIFSLIMGQDDVTLFTAELPEFGFNFFYKQKFPIFGPLVASLGGGIGGTIDLGFGYDTRGLQQFIGSFNPATLINGFFLNDLDPITGEDRPEATLTATIVASAQLDFLIASAGVEGGVDINIFFNLADLDHDGKIRFDEMAANLAANSFNPLSVFDTSGVAEFFMRAFIEINLLVTKIRKTFEFVRVELFSFDIPFNRPGILATQDGDVLTLSIGSNSENRLNGNVSDISEKIHVKSDGGDVLVWSDQFFVGEGLAQRFSGVNTIIADGGQGNDEIDLSGLNSGYEVIVHGGVGNDVIVGSKGDDDLYGDEGNDTILGMGGKDLVDGGAGNDNLYGDFQAIGLTIEGRSINSIFGGTEDEDTLKGGAGNDNLFGNGGNDTLDAGTGTDSLDGGADDDVYLGLLVGGANTIATGTGFNTLDFSDVRDRVNFTLRNGQVVASWEGNTMTASLDEISTILGGRSDDTFHVYETRDDGVTTLLDGQQKNDKYIFYAEDGDPIDALVNDQGNAWDNGNIIEARGTTGDDTISLTNATISLGVDQLITYVAPPATENILQIKLKSRAGRDSINVKSTADTVPVTVFSGEGDDTVTVGDSGTLDNIGALLRPGLNVPFGLGPLTLVGEGGHDTVVFDDSNDADNEFGNLTSFIENRAGNQQVEVGVLSGLGMTLDSDAGGLTGRVEFEGFEAVDVQLGGGADDFRVGGDEVLDELTLIRQGNVGEFTNLIDGIVSISGNSGGDKFRIEATNDIDRDALNAALGIISATTTTPGGASNEVQRINVGASIGYFTLKFRFMETAPIALNATAAEVQEALEDLFIIGTGNVDVTKDGSDFVVEFVNDLANTDVDQLEAKVIPFTVFGNGNGDQLFVQSLTERMYFQGGTGDDLVKLNVDATTLAPLASNGVQSEITLDGGENSDTYQLGLIGGATDSLIHVFDSGLAGTDVLEVTGTENPDRFLLRAAAAESGLAFIALMNTDPNVERINYNTNLEVITIDSLAGEDEFYIDDTRAAITINSGADNDFFQVGQLYKSRRTPELAGVAQEDVFATIETTRGFLSNGISNDMTINAGDNEDEIIVFHNLAVLTVNGDAGDDTILVQAFALVGSQEDKRERTDVSGGADADFIAYAVNAPVNIDGGDGFDTVIVVGTEFGDDFVITENGVFGAGLNVNFTNVEKLEVNGAEGDDRFFVQSTGENFTTSIVGDRGSDTFFINGETPANGVISNDLKGHSGIITHSVESTLPGSDYDGAKVVGVSSNVADNDEPAIIINQSDGQSQVVEGGGADTYTVILSRPPRPATKIKVTALPPEGLVFVDEFGTELRNETTGAPIGAELIFDETNWNVEQEVRFKAIADGNAEGNHTAAIQHKVSTIGVSTGPVFEEQEIFVPVPVFVDVPIFKQIHLPFIGTINFFVGFETQFSHFNNVSVGTELVQVGTENVETAESDAFTGVIEGATGLKSDPVPATPTLTDLEGGFPTAADPTRPDGLRGAFVTIIDDPANPDAVGQTRLILSNTTTELTLDQAWDSLPSNQARYEIGQFSGLVIPTVEVAISDSDVASLVITETQRETIVSEGASSGWDIIQVALSQSLAVGEIVTVSLDGHGQLEFRDAVTDAVITSLTFNSGGPATVKEFKVLAVDDGVTEGFHRSDLTLTAASNQAGSDFNGIEHTLVADIGDNEFAGVLVKQTNGSTDVVEGGDDAAFDGRGTDSYTVVLTKELAVGEVVTVAVTAQPTRTSRTGTTPHPDSVRAFEVEVEVSLDGITWAESVDVVFDDDNPWDVEQTVFVRAVDDSRVDGGDSKVFAPILDLANNIKGPLFIVGGFGEDRSGLFEREPIMLPGETNFKESMGDVLAATEADEFNPATLTIDPTDPEVLDFLGRTAETVTADDFLELTVEITRGEGKNKIRIIEAAEFDLDGNVVLTLNKAWDIPFSEPGVPTPASEFTISDTNPNFLVDEATQTDLLFFKDTDNPTNFQESAFASGQLFFDDSFDFVGHRITGLGMGGDRNIGGALQPGGVTFQQLEEVEIVLGSGNNQFTIEDTHAGATTLKTGDGADVVNVKSINGHTFVNTGEDSDTVNVTNDGQTLEDLLGLLTLSGDIPQAETVHFANGSPAQGSVPAVDAIQHLNIDATGGTFTLSLGGETTVALAHDASEVDVQTALESLSTIGAGNVAVTKAGSFYRIAFQNAMGGQAVDLLAVNDFNLTNGLGTHDILNIDDSGYADPSVAVLTQTTLTGLSIAQTNEIQTLVVDATAGTFRLSYEGAETEDLAHTISAADLEQALEDLAGIGDGNVAVTQNDDVYVIRFQGDLTNTNVSDIIVSLNNLEITTETYPDTFETVAGDASVHTRVDGDAANAVNDMQQLTVNATGGTYTLSLLGRTTDPIAYDASAEVVRKALQVLVADDDTEEFKTDVTVDKFGRTYLIGFQGKLNELNGRPGVELLVVNGSGLTGGEADVATRMDGINYYGFETLNLSLGSNNDILNVQGTSPGSNGFAAAGGIAVTNIDLGQGNEQIFVASNADLDFGSADAFQFLTGDLDDIEGALNLDTGDGRHRLMVSDEGATVGDGDVSITDTLPAVLNGLAATADIWIQGLAPAGIAYGTDGSFYDGITYWTGSGADTISIDGSHFVNGERTTTTLNTGLGNDNVTVDLDDGEDGFFVLNTMGGAESANPDLLDGTETDDDEVDASNSTLPLTIFGGIGNDTILSGSADDIIFGDFGRVIYTNALGGVVAVHGFGGRGDRVSSDILPPSLMFSLHRDLGGSDTISGRAGGDEIFGGNSGDTLYGDDATESSGTDDTIDVIFGDNGVIELEDGMYAKIKTTDTTDATGGADTIFGNADDDIVLAGVNGSVDVIHGNDSKDVILGDNGELDFTVDGDLTTLDTVRTTDTHLGGEDHIFGFGDDDLIFGGTGDDQIHGGTENDIIFGDFGYAELINNIVRYVVTIDRTEGGADTIWGDEHEDVVVGGANSDRLDGGEGRDLLFGDNVELDRLGVLFTDYTNPRFRTLTGDRMYGETPGVDDGEVLVASTHYVDPTGSAVWADFDITLLDHSATDEALALNNFGDDYMAGGADDDQMFGMLGDDTMQGDGSIDLATDVTAYRTTLNMLMGNPSVENALTDGDDYIEGNGGTDVIFGNLGQDDIIGGSSNLFSLITPEQRPDGMDLLFGGAGTDLARNDMGDDTLAEGHALDSDAIAGDNANIFRLLQSADPTQFESFNYDIYSATLRIVPRPVEFLDYTQGGPDIMGVDAATLGDIGDNDEIHGESGDDFIYGMVGNDVLYGEGQDDDIVGGWGHDWISGGTGSDGVLGDDGRIYTSRNTSTTEGQYAEPLYGIETVETDQQISSSSPWFNATIHAEGELKKTVNLTPFNVDPNTAAQSPHYRALYADDIIYGGLGDDFLHGGSGDDAISGAEALATSAATVYPDTGTTDPNRTDGVSIVTGYFTPFNPGNVLSFEALVAEEFASYDENDPRRKIMINGWEFFLNFDETEGPIAEGSTLPTDGNDRIFGDLGNDWIVGGTGRDHTYGGYGNDLLNNDDNHNSTAGTADPEANDEVDGPEYSYEDISLGGAGRDVLIANTAGDRQVDSTGEFNSFIVPQSPFGPGSATRGMEPGMIQFFYDLSEADGADPTRAADTGSDPERNGEPHGELGLVTQQDPDWGDQHGAPDDPQAGNGKKKTDHNGPRTAEPNNTTASSNEMQNGKKNGQDNNVETTASTEPEPATTESQTLVFDDGSGSFQEMATTDEGWVLDGSTITNPEGATYNVFDMTEEEYLLFISTVGAIDDDGDHTQVLIDWNAL
ncbi:LEPR-XLL domain-containing protein [Nitrospina sp. 32_T5]|uniref:LEPR-XLL domain-containing protein n=1 Tax=unclassified Nitrospina TaxID=2638683 RepID=UPI003F944203